MSVPQWVYSGDLERVRQLDSATLDSELEAKSAVAKHEQAKSEFTLAIVRSLRPFVIDPKNWYICLECGCIMPRERQKCDHPAKPVPAKVVEAAVVTEAPEAKG